MKPHHPPALSFELYPPRGRISEEKLAATVEKLEEVRPDYVSVTAAVDGQRRRQSLRLLDHLVHRTGLRPLAHVIATGQPAPKLRELIGEMIDLGVRGFLALRGDRPEGHHLLSEELPFARHLAELIRDVERQRVPELCAGRLAVGVAAYPVRHPDSSSIHQDTEVLLAKQRAGADFAITQVYTDPTHYSDLVARASANGVDLPLVPGILPVTSLKRYLRVCELAGLAPDADFAHRLETARTEAERLAVGVDHAEYFARQALDAGAPGLQLYTFNEHRAALELVDRLGLRAGRTESPLTSQENIVTQRQNEQTSQQTVPEANPAEARRHVPSATIVGYPRIGPDREIKRALEKYWSGTHGRDDLANAVKGVRSAATERLERLGLTDAASIPASWALYDQVLDVVLATGAVPRRLADLRDDAGALDEDAAFVLARGDDAHSPLEMTKWFDTNYHYLVPEIGPETPLSANTSEFGRQLQDAASSGSSEKLRPALVGPLTFLLLSKADDDAPEGFDPLSRLQDLTEVYRQIIADLGAAGAEWVQLDEPGLVADVDRPDLAEAVRETYRQLTEYRGDGRPSILVTTPYGDAEGLLEPLVESGVEAVHVDLTSGPERGVLRDLSPEQLALFTRPDSPTLVAGVVNGRNVWRTDLRRAFDLVERLRDAGARVSVGTSTSLIHVPHDVERETRLSEAPKRWLAFADQKVEETVALARGLAEGGDAIEEQLRESDEALRHRAETEGVRRIEIRERRARLSEDDARREPFEVRREAQEQRGVAADLPQIPTTTIGSFPQTPELRAVRSAHRAGRVSDADYDSRLRQEIREVISLQEDIGLDLLVHGEPERNDMVQYFAEHFEGFDTTQHGWVQSYGSRCTRPSILWGDVKRVGPGIGGEAITVPWASYAQSLTDRPVKGMLTGPVTILAWSFIREDVPVSETAEQVALALRDEVRDLEAAGIRAIQVDEPALRELLPLRRRDHADYLEWSVRAFRIATSGVRPETQIHTHLCYSEFGEVLSAIDALDADVTSVEAARSRMELLGPLSEIGFERGIGPGVWDIHSPRVPAQEEISELLATAASVVPRGRLWANPDCGLKTRGYAETTAALRHLVAGAHGVRETVAV